MTKFVIEKNVPVNSYRSRGIYPFHIMEVGDSFLVYGTDRYTIRAAAYASGRQNNKKYATRKDGDAMRVWRIK